MSDNAWLRKLTFVQLQAINSSFNHPLLLLREKNALNGEIIHIAMVSVFPAIRLQIFLLAVFLEAVANGQRAPDPGSLLQVISRNYSQAKHYHIEVHLSEDLKGELSGNWSNSFQAAIVAPDGRYRFEARGPRYSWLQVSNGKNEWIYDGTAQEYAQKHTSPDRKPGHFGTDQWSYEESRLVDAQDIPEHVAEKLMSVRNPEHVGSEALSFGGENIDCFVIRGEGEYKSGWSPDTKWELTFWIEKGSNYVRKIEEHWEGELINGDSSHYTRANVEFYPLVNLENPPVSPSLFEFQAPPTAKLVASFKQTHPLPTPKRSALVGRMAPELSFRSPNGRLVPLSSIRGKPVLIEFWATWCGPCIGAFPKLEQLYSQAASQGIVVITVDEDERPETADTFLATHRTSSWSNYHDDGEINRSLPGEGLPQFVLIDGTGKIVYAKSGFDEHELRAAFSHLGAWIHVSR